MPSVDVSTVPDEAIAIDPVPSTASVHEAHCSEYGDPCMIEMVADPTSVTTGAD